MKESGERGGSAPATSTGKRPYHRKQPLPFRKDRNLANGNRQQHNKDPHNGLIVFSSHQHQHDPSNLANFCQSMLRISSLHILQSAGYDAVQANPMSVLVDCLTRYLEFLAEAVKDFAELSGRSQVTAFDVVDGFSELGIDISALKEWAVENGGEALAPASSLTEGSNDTNRSEPNAPGPNSGAGTGATSAPGANSTNRPAFPTWKGADPGRVINDLLWNGRKRDLSDRDIYEWRAVPEGFIIPETDEDQDEYAYPEGSDEEVDHIKETVMTQERHSKWIPGSKPSYIPDFIPPFPGSSLPEDEAVDDDEDDEDESIKKSQSTEFDILSPSHIHSATATQDSEINILESVEGNTHPDLAKLSINTTTQLKEENSEINSTAKLNDIDNKSNFNPYTHVVPFQESSLPLPTLHTATPVNADATAPRKQRSGATGLSQDVQQLFSDTLVALMDPMPYPPSFSKRLKRQSRIAHMIARPSATTDTLFSDSPHPGLIDTQLKLSLPFAITHKFMSPGISVDDIPPGALSENTASAIYAEYHAQEANPTNAPRSSTIPIGSRKSSFSNSPLSSVTYPPRDNISLGSNGHATNMAGSMVKNKPGSRKPSVSGVDSGALISGSLQPVIPTSSPQQSGTTLGNIGTVGSNTLISPNILSRIGSNFDPSALLATQGPGAGPVGDRTATVNGLTSEQQLSQSNISSIGSNAAQIGTSTVPKASTQLSGSSSNVTSASSAVSTSTVSAQSSSKLLGKSSTGKPIPGPISLSELPLSMSSAKTPSTATATPTTPSALATPKIRFKFSAMDAITSPNGDQGGLTPGKRDHGHAPSNSSGGHHHRSSSMSSTTGSTHHKKSKKSREYDFDDDDEDDDEERSREKKKKKKSKSKDKDRDRDRDRDRDSDDDGGGGGSSRHKHHKHKSSHRYDGSSKGTYSPSTSTSYNYAVTPQGSYQAADDGGEVIDCICSNPTLDDGLFMIACDKCEVWFHGRCVGVREGDGVETWYCKRCTLSNRV
ncbi:hypothetical protein BGZ76_008292 [Entomortierella beljakovae]|nr:hypothetical protein BGZ76_008292 [Entomortierella beljakovae]